MAAKVKRYKHYGFTNMRRTLNGLPVVDATAKKVIHVNLKDTENKVGRKLPRDCVFAKTCERELESPEVLVHRSRIYVMRTKNGKKFWERFMVTARMRSEIIAYDRGGTFEADDYVLYVPTETHALGRKRSTTDKRTPPTGTKRARRHELKNVRVAAGYA